MARRDKTFAVIGLGQFGSAVALELMRFENAVIGVDQDQTVAARHADQLTETVIADARDEVALREAGVGACSVAVVAIGEDIEASILATMNARLLGVETIWAKAATRTHHRILTKLGVDRVIHPEQETALHMAQMLHNPIVRDFVSLGNGYHVFNVVAPEGLEGKRMDDLTAKAPDDLRCLGLMRGTEFHGPGAGSDIRADDRLLLLGRRAALRAFADRL